MSINWSIVFETKFFKKQTWSYEIFGSGGGKQLAKENNVPLLAQIPIESDIYSGTGNDLPVVHTSRDSITAKVFLELAGTLCNALSVKQ